MKLLPRKILCKIMKKWKLKKNYKINKFKTPPISKENNQ